MMRHKSETIVVRFPRYCVVCATALAAVLIGIGSPVRAGFTPYFGFDMGGPGQPPTTLVNSLAARNSFVAALTGVGVENFESQTLGQFPANLAFAPTSVTATITTLSSSNNMVTNGMPAGTFATSGTQFLYESNGPLNDTVKFSAPVAGVGMYVTDLADGVGIDQIVLKLTFTDSTTMSFPSSALHESMNGNGNALFFGVVSSDPAQRISMVQILNTGLTPEAIGIDDLTIGTSAVPEPASIVLMGIGVLGLAAGYVRRGRSPSRPA